MNKHKNLVHQIFQILEATLCPLILLAGQANSIQEHVKVTGNDSKNVEIPVSSLPSKMIADVLPSHRRSLLEEDETANNEDSVGDTPTSNSAIFLEHCDATSPLTFPLSAGEAKGFIGLMDNSNVEIFLNLTESTEASGAVFHLELDNSQLNLFSPVNDNREDGSRVIRFEYEGIPREGGEMNLWCSDSVDIMVAYRDHSGYELPYQVTAETLSVNETEPSKTIGKITLTESQSARKPLRAKAIGKSKPRYSSREDGKRQNDQHHRHRLLRKSRSVAIHDETELSLQFDVNDSNSKPSSSIDDDLDESNEVDDDEDSDGDLLLTQVEVEEPHSGDRIYRSIIVDTKAVTSAASSTTSQGSTKVELTLESSDVDSNGDLQLLFGGYPFSSSNEAKSDNESSSSSGVVLLKAMITIELDGQVLDDHRIQLQTMTNTGVMVLHGGWIRKALSEAVLEAAGKGVTTCVDCWRIVVAEAFVLDPEHSYRVVATLKEPAESVIDPSKYLLLSNSPTDDEMEITEEMRYGRPPNDVRRQRTMLRRGLQSNSKKILVHGYCTSNNPFPISDFTNAIVFQDPTPNNNSSGRRLGDFYGDLNWSHNEFALKLLDFTQQSGITSCGIIGHSQGGAAALHLHTYYHSCLDEASHGGSRLIQSVGTPYQGTRLSQLASIAGFFGQGCGVNNDMTINGAAAWLSTIPFSKRADVHYFTTSFEDKWWRFDYCHAVTTVFLSEPDDGTVERSRGELVGGNNRGHKVKWCHIDNMRDGPQTKDSTRNAELNQNARY